MWQPSNSVSSSKPVDICSAILQWFLKLEILNSLKNLPNSWICCIAVFLCTFFFHSNLQSLLPEHQQSLSWLPGQRVHIYADVTGMGSRCWKASPPSPAMAITATHLGSGSCHTWRSEPAFICLVSPLCSYACSLVSLNFTVITHTEKQNY